MLFSSPTFLFVFLPVVLASYWLLSAARRPLLLGSSLLFYGWSEPVFLGIVLCSAGIDYVLGAQLVRLPARSSGRRWLVTAGVAGNVGLLVAVKYSGFLTQNFNAAISLGGWPPAPVPKILLPLGISFIVFEKITYVVDLDRRAAPPAHSFIDYLSYVFLFPKLLAGPIVKYRDLAAQIAQPSTPRFEEVRDGLLRFVQGLAKKVLLADPLAVFTDPVFTLPPESLTPATAWAALFGFCLQFYFDFSGYSDMAIGLGHVFGFRLRENFHHPYLATSFTDFWKRWHISLSSWVQQYLFRPLGGRRRVSAARGYLNIMICMVVIGLWHGANWTFVIWGGCHGLAMVAEAAFLLRWQRRLPQLVNIARTDLLVMLSAVFFRCDTVDHALGYFRALAGRTPVNLQPVILNPDLQVLMLVGTAIVFAPLLRRPSQRWVSAEPAATHRPVAVAFGLVLLICSLGRMAVGTLRPFLYFRF
jgi:alginate O-acetyltransferase complex protein AlgI